MIVSLLFAIAETNKQIYREPILPRKKRNLISQDIVLFKEKGDTDNEDITANEKGKSELKMSKYFGTKLSFA